MCRDLHISPNEFDELNWADVEDWMAYKAGEAKAMDKKIRKIVKNPKAKSAEQYTAHRMDQLIELVIQLIGQR